MRKVKSRRDIEEGGGQQEALQMSAIGQPPAGLQMSLKFEPITLVFMDLWYSVPMPAAAQPKKAKTDAKAKSLGEVQPAEVQALTSAPQGAPASAAAKPRLELLKVQLFTWVGLNVLDCEAFHTSLQFSHAGLPTQDWCRTQRCPCQLVTMNFRPHYSGQSQALLSDFVNLTCLELARSQCCFLPKQLDTQDHELCWDAQREPTGNKTPAASSCSVDISPVAKCRHTFLYINSQIHTQYFLSWQMPVTS